MDRHDNHSPQRLGLLFDYDFDAVAHSRLASSDLRFDRAGFDLFSLPGAFRLLTLDLLRLSKRLSHRAQTQQWAGVISHHELYGTLLVALVAESRGLPGPSVRAVLACQHKGYSRQILQSVCPDANLKFSIFPLDRSSSPRREKLDFPIYLKPVRATFSVMARMIDTPDALRAYLSLNRLDRWMMRRLLLPFERVRSTALPESGTSMAFIAEEPIWAPQFNLDGYVDSTGCHMLGVIDAVVYPGTQAFQRWEFPSRLSPAVAQRALGVAQKFLKAIGFSRGFFNLEFFYDKTSDRLTVIECNPRLSSQFGDLYRMVLGKDPHAMAIAIALGRDAHSAPAQLPTAKVAASLVWRAFSPGEIPRAPSQTRLRNLKALLPLSSLFVYRRSAAALSREFSWLDSHRYGVMNLGAQSWEQLHRDSKRASQVLGWPNSPYAHSLSGLTLLDGDWIAR